MCYTYLEYCRVSGQNEFWVNDQQDKTSYILQSTYEKDPNWHPINYSENILVYDVHEHLRKICIRFKKLVVSLALGEFNDDKVTVDIAYRYPSEEKFILHNVGIGLTQQGTRCSDSA